MKNLLKATLIIFKKSPVIPFRRRLSKFYQKHIRGRMYEDRTVFAEIEGIKYQLDLSTYAGVEAYYGNWEPIMVKIMKKYVKPGMTVMDVGARIGLRTFRLKKLVGKEGKVFAIDPKKRAFEALKRTAKLNNCSVVIDNLMLSDENIAREMKLDNYLNLKKMAKLDFIFMDIDGGEYRVIKGGIETLKKFKPMIMFEMHFSHLGKELTEKLIDLLASCGYSFFESDSLKEYSNKQLLIEEVIRKSNLHILSK